MGIQLKKTLVFEDSHMWGSDGIQSISYVGVDPGNHNVIFSTSLASTGPEFAKFPPRVSGFSLSTIFNSPPREGSNLFFFSKIFILFLLIVAL